MSKRLMSLAVLPFAAVVALAGPAQAGKPQPTKLLGNDISYPQCARSYPSGQAFGIVGVNGGLANNNNPCFASELRWAQASRGGTAQPKAALYVNTGNPSGAGPVWWPTSNTFYSAADGADSNDPAKGTRVDVPVPSAYGACRADNDAGCAYVYGWAKAYEDFWHRGVPNPASFTWWLDVETTNSWEVPGPAYPTAYRSNIADLRAMIDFFRSRGVGVGIYSTPYQWRQITGGTASAGAADPFSGVPNWVAGASAANPGALCSSTFTYGSAVSLVQYVSGRFDYDYSCP